MSKWIIFKIFDCGLKLVWLCWLRVGYYLTITSDSVWAQWGPLESPPVRTMTQISLETWFTLLYILYYTYYTFNSVRKSKVVESMTSKELMVCNFINENFRNSPTERTVWEWPNSCYSIFDDNSYTIIHDRHHVMNISSHRP